MEEALGLTAFPGASGNPNGALSAPIDMSDFFKSGTTSGSVTLSPASLTFAGQTVNTTSAAQTVTLNNATSSVASISGVSIGRSNSGDFRADERLRIEHGGGKHVHNQREVHPVDDGGGIGDTHGERQRRLANGKFERDGRFVEWRRGIRSSRESVASEKYIPLDSVGKNLPIFEIVFWGT